MLCPLCRAARKQDIWLETKRPTLLYRRCRECKLIWLDASQRLSPREEEARYRTHENDTTSKEYLAYLSCTAAPVVARVAPGSLGLDYGCGPTGGMNALLSPQGFRIVSYDPIFFPREDLLNFRYDFIVCSEAAEHFYEPASEFERISTITKPGGWLGVSSRLAPAREKFANWWYRRDPSHVVFYSEETIDWIAERFGWRVEFVRDPIWVLQKN